MIFFSFADKNSPVGMDFNIEHYNYHLPEENIARFPLKDRDASRLLLWDCGNMTHHRFKDVPRLLPEKSLLVFNDTKVIAARLPFKKDSGAAIEIFLLHPEQPTRDVAESMTLTGKSVWACLIGNKKKWKAGTVTCRMNGVEIEATYTNRDNNLIELSWQKGTFADIINKVGETPLPPYLHRKANKDDQERYQTVYSKHNGAVAAPTAGLHFTPALLNELAKKEIQKTYLTLHVSAGTFKPVEVDDYRQHAMHCEQIVVGQKSIASLIDNSERIIAVGTTSLRTLESLYWYGILLKSNPDQPFFISKTLPYQHPSHSLTFKESMEVILQTMKAKKWSEIHGESEIFIYPGYEIKSVKGIFTNFHLPKSTLLLLVSAFVGQAWKNIYQQALDHNYRFLSYGDSSLLLR